MREGLGLTSWSQKGRRRKSIKRRGQAIRLVQMLVDPQPGTSARGEG